jgi:glycosyltransferase involved in cell wall biosynthesis
MASPRISLVIPAMNEAENLRTLLPAIPTSVDEVIVVDGQSQDHTLEVVRQILPSAVIVMQTNTGKGAALLEGFAAATGEIIVILDADGSNDPTEIDKFVAAMERGADLVKGSRFCKGGGSADITWFRALGNHGLRMVVNVLYRARFTDLCYGMMAIRARCLAQLELDCQGFEMDIQIIVRALRARLRVVEVPSFESKRRFGESNLKPIRDGTRILRQIIHELGWHEHTAPAAIPVAIAQEEAQPT